MEPWLVYVLISADRRITYVGVTTDIERRLAQHNGAAPGGAKSTRRGRPWDVGVVYGPYPERGEAQQVERAIKSLPGARRLDGRR